ncbi:hypothetical protein IMZ48_01575 [Candidatus Bathyarchaeota archaeon]|nr:hypothetical protein [Candidatus Bathyarchaeota archaeon]
MRFPAAGFEMFSDSVIVEEEQFDDFKTGQYYPVKIGNVYDGKYQVLGKLGFGTTSIVWLALNLMYVLGKLLPKVSGLKLGPPISAPPHISAPRNFLTAT